MLETIVNKIWKHFHMVLMITKRPETCCKAISRTSMFKSNKEKHPPTHIYSNVTIGKKQSQRNHIYLKANLVHPRPQSNQYKKIVKYFVNL